MKPVHCANHNEIFYIMNERVCVHNIVMLHLCSFFSYIYRCMITCFVQIAQSTLGSNGALAWTKPRTHNFRLLVAILWEFHAAVDIIRAMVALGHYYMAVCLSYMDQLRSWNCIGYTLIREPTISNKSHKFLAECVDNRGWVVWEESVIEKIFVEISLQQLTPWQHTV